MFFHPSDGVFGRFDLAALCGCHTLNACYVMLSVMQFLVVGRTVNITTAAAIMILARAPFAQSLPKAQLAPQPRCCVILVQEVHP